MANLSLAQAARDAVRAYEPDAHGKRHVTLEELLHGCDWAFATAGYEPAPFVNALYGTLRRVEAAAYGTRQERSDLVAGHVARARSVTPQLHAMREEIEALSPENDLEELGQWAALDHIDWALGVIKDSFEAWGY